MQQQRTDHMAYLPNMEQIGEEFGISKMAVSKRLKKLLSRMRRLMET